VYLQAADGVGGAERLTHGSNPELPNSFSPDGKWLLFSTPDSDPRDIGIVSLEGERKADLLLHTTFNEMQAAVSPDGRWVAYQSNESGKDEVYVRPFPHVDSGRWQISVEGGTRPLWARNGRELFYYVPPGRVMTVPIRDGSSFMAGNTELLFEGAYAEPVPGPIYDVSPDGRRFLMIKRAQSTNQTSTARQLVMVLNWVEELKERVPVVR
jgi:serine/threonine-protein kinase